MSTKTIYISDSKWRTIDTGLRKDLLKVFQRDRYVGRFVANIESDLRAIGEHELAERLSEDLHYLPHPLRTR